MTVHTFKKTSGVSSPERPTPDDTNDLNFATGNRHSHAVAKLVAELAVRGHVVHQLKDGGFLISKYGHTRHAEDFDALQIFARLLGVPQ